MAYWQSEDERLKIHTGDAVTAMRGMEAESVDLVWADPPYHLSGKGTTCQGGKRKSVAKGPWDLPKTPMSHYAWTMTWLEEVRRILKPTGSIMVCGSMHNVYVVGFAMQTLGCRILNDIAWVKANPSPNLGCRTLMYAHESVLWASLGPRAKHHFNYKELKELNEGKQQKDVWKFGRPEKDEQAYGKHPTQKPMRLIKRCLTATLPDGGLVVDPFAGSGTTGVAAALGQDRGWRYEGIELEQSWNDVARKRIEDAIGSKREAA
jgi:site-specific DNA-methyltransferase (adenine-specific)